MEPRACCRVKADNYLLPSEANDDYLPAIITACLAFTRLNPHVYLDTVILLGSIATQFKELKLYFALGAMTASCAYFSLASVMGQNYYYQYLPNR